MKKLIIIVFLSFFVIFIFADEIVTTKDGKKVLLKKNGRWEYVNDDNIDIQFADDAVVVWDSSLIRSEVNYSDAVKLFIHYQNLTNKKIIGISVNIKITNTFGEIVLNTTINDEVLLKPNQKLKNTTYRYWDDNKFVDGEPYDKMWKLADNGTAKISIKILKVIFDDGTILLAKENKK